MDPNSPEYIIDQPLKILGFVYEELSATRVSGHLTVTDKCCQPFKVLHGGVSALIAEGLASLGAGIASGYKRVAGIHLSIHHLRPAVLGDLVFAESYPVNVGKNIQVWEVRLWKTKKTKKSEEKIMVSTSRVTLFCGVPIPDHVKDAPDQLKKFVSKL
ncbi:PREDICTED: 1,4-dihydroxy-2-naphthoyl-CoA thioesterase 2-like isoform X1 [Camelina sativa]|uniref:1,4-dihydroxy-2-naphthoyl-CoA thioesterase 2-like isoform X1 n=1 Tax=Camelina sativa TaxID=90675 RepID=A0ABM1R958_CAMSA|nr:PREDICTED: 1,4-dihydroxy-2-naphthoyl-CoA thioesterase 2-like isoform X2 [Camelina sativa]XP_019095546.1 PREDICTED: 1,4-dihydroxy-2-naphthoyl-CoA thioesterase 2-like isoform X1 [Camelina sativa]